MSEDDFFIAVGCAAVLFGFIGTLVAIVLA
jgi:hypothetical protein